MGMSQLSVTKLRYAIPHRVSVQVQTHLEPVDIRRES